MGALIVGIAAGVGCFFASTTIKGWFKYDDSLDAFGVHCIGGIIGAILTGVLNVREISGVDGSVTTQLGAVVTTLVYSGVGSFIILKVIDMAVGRASPGEQERERRISACTAGCSVMRCEVITTTGCNATLSQTPLQGISGAATGAVLDSTRQNVRRTK
jgi:ammonia channel protein AmtB